MLNAKLHHRHLLTDEAQVYEDRSGRNVREHWRVANCLCLGAIW